MLALAVLVVAVLLWGIGYAIKHWESRPKIGWFSWLLIIMVVLLFVVLLVVLLIGDG